MGMPGVRGAGGARRLPLTTPNACRIGPTTKRCTRSLSATKIAKKGETATPCGQQIMIIIQWFLAQRAY